MGLKAHAPSCEALVSANGLFVRTGGLQAAESSDKQSRTSARNSIMLSHMPPTLGLFLTMISLTMPYTLRQGSETVVSRGVRARALGGTVRDATGAPLGDVSVFVFDCGHGEFRGRIEPTAIGTTRTDPLGRFSLKWSIRPRACIQFRMRGMNLLQMEVIREQHAGELDVTLVPGT